MVGQLPNCWWILILLGICAGIISGGLGLGSGTVVVPALVLICGLTQKSAQGTALAVMVPMALLGALRYWQDPKIEMSGVIIGLIVLGALAGVLIGTTLASRLPSHVLKTIFAIFLGIVALKMFFTSPRSEQRNLSESVTNQKEVNVVEGGSPNAKDGVWGPQYGGTQNEAGQQ